MDSSGWINPCGTLLQCTIPRSRPMSKGHHIGIGLLAGRVCFTATSLFVPSSSVLSSKHGSKRHNGFNDRNNVHHEADIRVTLEFMCVRSRIRCRIRAAVFLFSDLQIRHHVCDRHCVSHLTYPSDGWHGCGKRRSVGPIVARFLILVRRVYPTPAMERLSRYKVTWGTPVPMAFATDMACARRTGKYVPSSSGHIRMIAKPSRTKFYEAHFVAHIQQGAQRPIRELLVLPDIVHDDQSLPSVQRNKCVCPSAVKTVVLDSSPWYTILATMSLNHVTPIVEQVNGVFEKLAVTSERLIETMGTNGTHKRFCFGAVLIPRSQLLWVATK